MKGDEGEKAPRVSTRTCDELGEVGPQRVDALLGRRLLVHLGLIYEHPRLTELVCAERCWAW